MKRTNERSDADADQGVRNEDGQVGNVRGI